MPRRYAVIDVFTAKSLQGNPLAVVVDADGLDGKTMQRFAAWTNLSETTFLLPPTQAGADYRVRIFTPRSELPFAGHPSVGSAFVAIESGLVEAGKRELVQECAAGLLPVRVEGEGASRHVHVRAPKARLAGEDAMLVPALRDALGAEVRAARNVCNGPWWIVADLGDESAVRALHPDMSAIAALTTRLAAVGVCVFGRSREPGFAMAVRAFCPADGIPEDPVTGSANAAIAACLHATGKLAGFGDRYRASQGREVGRDGVVEVAVDGEGEAWIGGECARVVTGSVDV
ncbi:MAG TPA: PhzF family phenazine biosynthesis protein [Rhodanobacteraceae bacterium]|jgi:PhzF family phenazine biosynthesis protein|nr:PhzF family phenazine biosynthesis protein [Rhodanobacteraceae bacterium]